MQQFDLAAIGEALVELTPDGSGGWRAGVAGDVVNTLAGASRLGLRTALLSALGSDPFTATILDTLDREGIDRSVVAIDGRRTNGLYTNTSVDDGERRFSYWRRGSAAAGMIGTLGETTLIDLASRSRLLLLTGVTLAIVEEHERLAAVLRQIAGETALVLDTNYRPALWNYPDECRQRWESILSCGSILLPSWDDLEAMYGGAEIASLLVRWSDGGRRTVIVKRGERGCAWVEGDRLVEMPPLTPEHLVDASGAGDAFNAGVLAGLLAGETVQQACVRAQNVAVRVLRVRGAWPGGER